MAKLLRGSKDLDFNLDWLVSVVVPELLIDPSDLALTNRSADSLALSAFFRRAQT